MFKTLLFKEIYEHLKTFRFSAALITTFVLVIVSVWVLGGDFAVRNSEFNRMAESYALRNKEVYVPSQFGPVVLRPLSPLSVFAQGESGHLGNAVEISRWYVPSEADDYLTVNSLLHSMPPFDLMTIFVFAISLFGVLLTFDAFSGERERGTLKLLCSYSAKRGMIFIVKFVAGIIVLSIPFLISFISSLIVLQFVHSITFSGIEWAAIVSMVFIGLLFGAVFIAVGIICSSVARRSYNALALALLFWAFTVILVPSLADNLAAMLQPLHSREEISNYVQETTTDIRRKMREFHINNDLNLSSMGSSGIGRENFYWFDGYPEWLRDHIRYVGFYEDLYQRRADEVWRLEKKHSDRKRDQFRLGSLLKSISPASQLRKSITALAYTDYSTHADFLEQCRKYREAILSDFQRKGFFSVNLIHLFTRLEWSDLQTREQTDKRVEERERLQEAGDELAWRIESFGKLPDNYFPEFQYQGSVPRFEAAIVPGAVLAFMTILAVAIGLTVAIRYDVR